MKSLLVLEDEPSVMKLLRHMLEQYTLILATTAEQAIQLFKDNAQQIDLLLADVTLERSSGIHVALLLRSEVPRLPVILTSGHPVSQWSDRDAADFQRLAWQSLAFLQKPFQAKLLLNAVRELIGTAQPDKARTAGP
jgi:CheY-like chemotaxis protein